MAQDPQNKPTNMAQVNQPIFPQVHDSRRPLNQTADPDINQRSGYNPPNYNPPDYNTPNYNSSNYNPSNYNSQIYNTGFNTRNNYQPQNQRRQFPDNYNPGYSFNNNGYNPRYNPRYGQNFNSNPRYGFSSNDYSPRYNPRFSQNYDQNFNNNTYRRNNGYPQQSRNYSNNNYNPRNAPSNPRNPVVCYHCSKIGHIRAECYTFLRQQRGENQTRDSRTFNLPSNNRNIQNTNQKNDFRPAF